MKFYQEHSNAFRILSKGRVVLDVFAKGVRSATVISAVAASALMADVAPTALPDHPTIINGNINIQTNTANMVVNQSTNKGIINWGSFNIGSGASVHFNQPNASSSTLNRVVGNEISTIAGNLSATGNIILINPNGVIFSNGSRVDVGGIIASTMNLSNENYLNNTLHFTRDGNTGTITNTGTIRAQDAGYVALLAPEVLNEGVIIAQKGSVVFASGDAVTLSADNAGLLNVTVDAATVNTLIENRGLVEASSGVVYMSAKAASDALSATVSNSGTIQASSMVEKGGKIVLLGSGISNSGTIEAKGTTGGGEILIGGDYQGTNAGIYHQATTTTLTSTSIIDASATDNGDGGKVVAWSDITNSNSVTTAQGTILAKGGINGGNGGNIETSGHILNTDGLSGSAAAVKGNAGTWLFDPTNVIIGSSGSSASGNNDGTSTLTASSIASLLNGGTSVTVTTYSGGSDLGDLTVNSAITKSSGNNDVTLTLRAANSIVINNAISNTGGSGKLNLTFDADNNTNAATSTPSRDGGGIVILGANLSTGGGTLTFGGTASNGLTGGDLYIGGGSNAISLTTSGGALDVKGQLIIATSNASGVTFSTSGGNITLGGSVDSGNTYTAVSGTWTWDQAKTNAATVANSYLATITTRLENALAIRAAGYTDAWLGGQRITGSNLWEWVTDPAYNSSTNPMIFFYQGSSTQTQLGGTSSGAGGSTATGYYANWNGWTNGVASGEPNNWNGSAPGTFANNYESVLQFTGSLGKWNDLPTTSTINQYVRETNLSPSKLTLNAGSGSVIINGAVGASKALSSLDVTSSSTQVNGSAIITTGAQNYSSSLTVNNANSNPMPDVTLQGTGLTVNGAITVYGGSNIYLNSNITTTDDLWLSATSINAGGSERIVQTGSGDVRITANSVTNGGITISSTTGAFIYEPNLTNWDNIGGTLNVTGTLSSNNFTGGSDVAWLKIQGVSGLTGLQIGKVGNTSGVQLGTPWTINGAINIYGANILIDENLDTQSAGNLGKILLKATDNITLAASKSIVTNAGDITLWADSNDNGGYIYINDGVTLDSRTSIDRGNSAISTANGGGAINLGGGSASAILASSTVVPTGYALENSSTLAGGIEFGTYGGGHNANISLYSGGGDVTVRGKSTSAYSTESNGIVAFEGLKVDTGTTGNIIIDGQGGSGSASYSGGIYLGFHGTNNQASTLLRTGNGNITLTGTGSNATNNRGVILNGGTSQQITVESTGTGAITLTGSGATQDNILFSSNILASSGAITITGTSAGPLYTDLALNTIGFKSGSHVTASTSNITLTDDSFSFASGKGLQLNTTGTVTVQSYSNSFSNALTWPMSDLALSANISGLTIGKNTNTADITIANTTSITGPISIYGGNIAINAGLISLGSGANALITLKASGNVTDGVSGFVQTGSDGNGNLLLLGGNVTLDNSTSNDIYTLAASGLSGLKFVDKAGLNIGTVNGVNGISATGIINIGTQLGGMLVTQNVSTTDASSTALTLNASIGSSVGTDTSYNIVLSGTPSITVGTGGIAKLFTGSVSGSTGVTTLVGSGSGNFRYNADETTNFSTGSWTNLGSTGTYAIYREQPTANITNMTLNMTYGDAALPSVSATGTVNGDISSYTITSAQYSSSNNLKANNSGYTITSNLAGLGYNVTGVSSGALTVNTKSLSVTGLTIADKTYNGSDAASTSAAGSLSGVFSGNSTTDDVGFSTVATFNNKNVEATKTVNLDYTLSGTDAANYTLADATGVATTAKINAATVTLSATKTYDGTTALSGSQVTISTGVGSETLTYTGATANDAHVATAAKYISAITLEDGTNGGLASNYALPILNATNAVVTIDTATLTPTISNTGITKTYDGTTNAPTGFIPTYTFAGFASGDTGAALGLTGAVYDHADATGGSAATKITVSGLSISSITGNKGSQASDYVLDTTSKDVAATITKAALTVTANNDSRFYSETDTTSYAGVRYNGFVQGESNSVLGGTLAIARSDSSNNNVGSDTLTPSGLTSNNYTITNATGTYTIIPANQLQIIVTDKSATYGDALTYSITSAKYLASDNSTINALSVTDNGSNSFTVDGVTFIISPTGTVTTSTAGNIQAGSYQLGSSSVTGASSNFSNTIVTTGALSVAQKSLTPTASSVSKVYDGTTAMTGVTIGFNSAPFTNDLVIVSGLGAFDNKNVGNANKNYTISNLALLGADAANYYLSGGSSFTGTDGTITPKSITAITGITASDKTYNGSDTATLSTSGAGFTGIIGGDTLSVATSTGTFSDKNVGIGKTVSVTGLTLGGADVLNYNLTTTTASTTASISRLSSVTWIGGATGNWFDPANWAGGAVPDLSNVANVVIPSNVTVTFDTTGAVIPADASQAVNITAIGTSGSLTQTNGTLNIGSGGMSLNTYTQNGGTLTNTGTTTLTSYNQTDGSFSGTGNFSTANFTQIGGTTALTNNFNVTNDFTQGTSGSVTVGGNTSITDTTGGTTIGNLSTTGTTSITSTGGAITQDSGTSIVSGGMTTLHASNGVTKYDITLNGNNNFQSTVNANGNNITLKDTTGGLALGNVTAEGILDVTSTNGAIIQTSGTTIVVGGTSTLEASNGTTPATYYDINLNGANNDFQSSVNATGRNVTLNDINSLVALLNASGTSSLTSGGTLNVSGTTQNLTTTSDGATTFGTTTVHGNLTTTSGGDVTQSSALVVDGVANVNAPGHNIDLSNASNDFNTFGGNASFITLRDINSITLENITTTGNFSLNSGGSISQTSGSTLNIGALTTLVALNDINLPNLNNHFGGLVNIDSQSASIGSNERVQTGTVHTVSPLKILGSSNQNNFIPPYIHEVAPQPEAPVITESTATPSSTDIFAQPTAGPSAPSNSVIETAALATSAQTSTTQQGTESPSDNGMLNALQNGEKVSFDGIIVGATHTGNPVKAIIVQGDASSPTPVTLVVTVKAGEGFSFSLPQSTVRQVAQSMVHSETEASPLVAGVSLSDGNPLPPWMKFDSKTMEFTSTNVPTGGLPLTVNVVISQNGIVKTIEVVLKNSSGS